MNDNQTEIGACLKMSKRNFIFPGFGIGTRCIQLRQGKLSKVKQIKRCQIRAGNVFLNHYDCWDPTKPYNNPPIIDLGEERG